MIILDKPVQGSELVREFLLESGVATARFKKKQLFTPYDQRMRMITENMDKPEEFRTRSLRRKLTKLDRALSDDEASALDRAFNGWLILNGKSKSIDPEAVYGANSQQEPLDQHELERAADFSKMSKRLHADARQAMNSLFAMMAPWNDEVYRIDILDAIKVARLVKSAYEQKEQKKNLQS